MNNLYQSAASTNPEETLRLKSLRQRGLLDDEGYNLGLNAAAGNPGGEEFAREVVGNFLGGVQSDPFILQRSANSEVARMYARHIPGLNFDDEVSGAVERHHMLAQQQAQQRLSQRQQAQSTQEYYGTAMPGQTNDPTVFGVIKQAKEVEKAINVYIERPEIFSVENVRELSLLAQKHNLPFDPFPTAEHALRMGAEQPNSWQSLFKDATAGGMAAQFVYGAMAGMTTVTPEAAKAPKAMIEEFAYSIGHLMGFLKGIPMKGAGLISKAAGIDDAIQQLIVAGKGGNLGRVAATMAGGGFNLGMASAISAREGGPQAMFDAALGGAVAGAFFPSMTLIPGEGKLRQVIGTVASGAFSAVPAFREQGFTPQTLYDFLLGGYFGWKETALPSPLVLKRAAASTTNKVVSEHINGMIEALGLAPVTDFGQRVINPDGTVSYANAIRANVTSRGDNAEALKAAVTAAGINPARVTTVSDVSSLRARFETKFKASGATEGVARDLADKLVRDPRAVDTLTKEFGADAAALKEEAVRAASEASEALFNMHRVTVSESGTVIVSASKLKEGMGIVEAMNTIKDAGVYYDGNNRNMNEQLANLILAQKPGKNLFLIGASGEMVVDRKTGRLRKATETDLMTAPDDLRLTLLEYNEDASHSTGFITKITRATAKNGSAIMRAQRERTEAVVQANDLQGVLSGRLEDLPVRRISDTIVLKNNGDEFIMTDDGFADVTAMAESLKKSMAEDGLSLSYRIDGSNLIINKKESKLSAGKIMEYIHSDPSLLGTRYGIGAVIDRNILQKVRHEFADVEDAVRDMAGRSGRATHVVVKLRPLVNAKRGEQRPVYIAISESGQGEVYVPRNLDVAGDSVYLDDTKLRGWVSGELQQKLVSAFGGYDFTRFDINNVSVHAKPMDTYTDGEWNKYTFQVTRPSDSGMQVGPQVSDMESVYNNLVTMTMNMRSEVGMRINGRERFPMVSEIVETWGKSGIPGVTADIGVSVFDNSDTTIGFIGRLAKSYANTHTLPPMEGLTERDLLAAHAVKSRNVYQWMKSLGIEVSNRRAMSELHHGRGVYRALTDFYKKEFPTEADAIITKMEEQSEQFIHSMYYTLLKTTRSGFKSDSGATLSRSTFVANPFSTEAEKQRKYRGGRLFASDDPERPRAEVFNRGSRVDTDVIEKSPVHTELMDSGLSISMVDVVTTKDNNRTFDREANLGTLSTDLEDGGSVRLLEDAYGQITASNKIPLTILSSISTSEIMAVNIVKPKDGADHLDQLMAEFRANNTIPKAGNKETETRIASVYESLVKMYQDGKIIHDKPGQEALGLIYSATNPVKILAPRKLQDAKDAAFTHIKAIAAISKGVFTNPEASDVITADRFIKRSLTLGAKNQSLTEDDIYAAMARSENPDATTDEMVTLTDQMRKNNPSGILMDVVSDLSIPRGIQDMLAGKDLTDGVAFVEPEILAGLQQIISGQSDMQSGYVIKPLLMLKGFRSEMLGKVSFQPMTPQIRQYYASAYGGKRPPHIIMFKSGEKFNSSKEWSNKIYTPLKDMYHSVPERGNEAYIKLADSKIGGLQLMFGEHQAAPKQPTQFLSYILSGSNRMFHHTQNRWIDRPAIEDPNNPSVFRLQDLAYQEVMDNQKKAIAELEAEFSKDPKAFYMRLIRERAQAGDLFSPVDMMKMAQLSPDNPLFRDAVGKLIAAEAAERVFGLRLDKAYGGVSVLTPEILSIGGARGEQFFDHAGNPVDIAQEALVQRETVTKDPVTGQERKVMVTSLKEGWSLLPESYAAKVKIGSRVIIARPPITSGNGMIAVKVAGFRGKEMGNGMILSANHALGAMEADYDIDKGFVISGDAKADEAIGFQNLWAMLNHPDWVGHTKQADPERTEVARSIEQEAGLAKSQYVYGGDIAGTLFDHQAIFKTMINMGNGTMAIPQIANLQSLRSTLEQENFRIDVSYKGDDYAITMKSLSDFVNVEGKDMTVQAFLTNYLQIAVDDAKLGGIIGRAFYTLNGETKRNSYYFTRRDALAKLLNVEVSGMAPRPSTGSKGRIMPIDSKIAAILTDAVTRDMERVLGDYENAKSQKENRSLSATDYLAFAHQLESMGDRNNSINYYNGKIVEAAGRAEVEMRKSLAKIRREVGIEFDGQIEFELTEGYALINSIPGLAEKIPKDWQGALNGYSNAVRRAVTEIKRATATAAGPPPSEVVTSIYDRLRIELQDASKELVRLGTEEKLLTASLPNEIKKADTRYRRAIDRSAMILQRQEFENIDVPAAISDGALGIRYIEGGKAQYKIIVRDSDAVPARMLNKFITESEARKKLHSSGQLISRQKGDAKGLEDAIRQGRGEEFGKRYLEDLKAGNDELQIGMMWHGSFAAGIGPEAARRVSSKIEAHYQEEFVKSLLRDANKAHTQDGSVTDVSLAATVVDTPGLRDVLPADSQIMQYANRVKLFAQSELPLYEALGAIQRGDASIKVNIEREKSPRFAAIMNARALMEQGAGDVGVTFHAMRTAARRSVEDRINELTTTDVLPEGSASMVHATARAGKRLAAFIREVIPSTWAKDFDSGSKLLDKLVTHMSGDNDLTSSIGRTAASRVYRDMLAMTADRKLRAPGEVMREFVASVVENFSAVNAGKASRRRGQSIDGKTMSSMTAELFYGQAMAGAELVVDPNGIRTARSGVEYYPMIVDEKGSILSGKGNSIIDRFSSLYEQKRDELTESEAARAAKAVDTEFDPYSAAYPAGTIVVDVDNLTVTNKANNTVFDFKVNAEFTKNPKNMEALREVLTAFSNSPGLLEDLPGLIMYHSTWQGDWAGERGVPRLTDPMDFIRMYHGHGELLGIKHLGSKSSFSDNYYMNMVSSGYALPQSVAKRAAGIHALVSFYNSEGNYKGKMAVSPVAAGIALANTANYKAASYAENMGRLVNDGATILFHTDATIFNQRLRIAMNLYEHNFVMRDTGHSDYASDLAHYNGMNSGEKESVMAAATSIGKTLEQSRAKVMNHFGWRDREGNLVGDTIVLPDGVEVRGGLLGYAEFLKKTFGIELDPAVYTMPKFIEGEQRYVPHMFADRKQLLGALRDWVNRTHGGKTEAQRETIFREELERMMQFEAGTDIMSTITDPNIVNPGQHAPALEARKYDFRGYDMHFADVAKRYHSQIGRKVENDLLAAKMTYLMLSMKTGQGQYGAAINARMEAGEKEWPGFRDSWIGYTSRLTRNAIGYPSTDNASWFGLDINDKAVAARWNQFAEKYLGGKRDDPEGDLRRLSEFEGQYQTLALLAFPKAIFTNLLGAVRGIVVEGGWNNFRDASKMAADVRKAFKLGNTNEAIQKYLLAGSIDARGSADMPQSLLNEVSVILSSPATLTNLVRWESEMASFYSAGRIKAFGMDVRGGMKLADAVRKHNIKSDVWEAIMRKTGGIVGAAEFYGRTAAFTQSFVHARRVMKLPPRESVEFALKGVARTQHLYTAQNQPEFRNSSVGKILTRFQPWLWHQLKLEKHIIEEANNVGFTPGTPEYDRFIRTMAINGALLGLAAWLPFSLFSNVLTPPYSQALDLAQWAWDDDEKAPLGGSYGLSMVTGPALWNTIAGPTLSMMSDNFAHNPYAVLPAGRLVGATIRSVQRPQFAFDMWTGIPFMGLHQSIYNDDPQELEEQRMIGTIMADRSEDLPDKE